MCLIESPRKSQIAVDFAYWISEQDPATSVFWVHAGNYERFREGFQMIAETCSIPERKSSKANILKVVHDWLKNNIHGRWLLIVDNADDEELFFPPASPDSSSSGRKTPPLSEFLPECLHGSLLFTTRDQITAGRLTREDNLLKVDKMSEDDAQKLLSKKFKTSYDPAQISQLAQSLEYLPLALIQAASYIQRPGMSIVKYIELLKSDTVALLDKPPLAAESASDIPKALASTWLITFKYLRTNFHTAWRMFALISFLDSQAIPKSILRATGKDGVELEEALGHLLSFSLINERKEDAPMGLQNPSQRASGFEECFDMHPLVRLVTQEWLKSQRRAKAFENEMFWLLARAYPIDKPDPSWSTYDLYEPHVMVMLKRAPDRETREARANLLGKRGRMFALSYLPTDAVHCFEEVVELVSVLSGPDHPHTLRATFDLICARSTFGDAWANLVLCNQTMRKAIAVLDFDNYVMRLGVMAMAECLRRLSQYENALLLTIFAIEGHRESLGPNDDSILTLEDGIAIDLLRLSKQEKAERMLESQLQQRTQRLGSRHWSTLYTMHMLWLLYHSTDQSNKAEVVARERMAILEEHFSPEHHLTLHSRYNLALVFADTGKLDEAMELADSVLRVSIKIRGLGDPATLLIKEFMSVLELLRSHDQEAIEMMSETVKEAEKSLGGPSPLAANFAHKFKDWQQEASRIAFKKAWNEGSRDRRVILNKTLGIQDGANQRDEMRSHRKVLYETRKLVDTLLRGHQRSSISIFFLGTKRSIRRNKERLWERNADISPD